MDVWPVARRRPPVTAGEGEEEQDEGAQHHDAAAEVERQVVWLRVVEEPPWRAEKGRVDVWDKRVVLLLEFKVEQKTFTSKHYRTACKKF